MIILHISDIKNCKGNGVAVAVADYLKYEGLKNEVAIFNLNDNLIIDGIPSFSFNDFKTISSLPKPFNNPDIVIFNEVYKLNYIKISNECVKRNIKYVIIPHGCLTEQARNRSKIKKFFAINFLLKKFIKNATVIQYLNELEKNNTYIFNNRFIISGNGIDITKCKENNCTNKNIIFIGRYDINHKGLDIIVNVCKKYKSWFENNNIHIDLYGRDSNGNINKLNKLVNDFNLQNVLLIKGPVYGEKKYELLRNSYAFIQTSRFEGQPMSIIEALGNGLPCIVTFPTSFGRFVLENNCGYSSDLDIDNIFNNIKKIFENKRNRDKMSSNAIKSIIKYFDWNAVIEDCIMQYKKLLSEEE